MPDTPETLHNDRYAVIRLLGEGGQAATFEAVDKQRGSLVAVKRFRVRGAKSWKEVGLAEREARVLASLDHPALPRYVEHFEEGGELFLVTDKIEGESLAAMRKAQSTLDEGEVRRLLHDAAGALDYLHGRAPPIIHRDIKPSNVIRRPDGSFALIDFGAVRDKLKPEGGSTVVGTFGYMAPEQFQGRAMPASDVYALGTTALTLLTGVEPEHLPHRGLAIDVERALGDSRVSPALRQVLSAMLTPDPDQRASQMGPLLSVLDRDKGGERKAPTRGEQRRSRRDERRNERETRKAAAREAWAANPLARRAKVMAGIPRWILLFALLGLALAQVAVVLVLRVLLPTAFRLLSVVFGKGWRQAADTLSQAGKTAVASIGRAREVVRQEPTTDDFRGARIEVETKETAASGVRVEDDHTREVEAEYEAEAEADAEEARRREGR